MVAIVAWLAIALAIAMFGLPLGHDEAAYALEARGGGPDWLYRSSGMIAIARLGVAMGGSELAMRLPSALLGAGFVAAVWAMGRRAFGETTGAWAAAVIAGTHPMVLRAPELLGDLPGAACILAGAAVLVGELSARPPSWRLLLAAPAFAGAFYFRYGSAPVILIVCGVAAVLWWRELLARPLIVLATVGLCAALVIPHLIQSQQATGSLLGILDVSAGMPRRAYVGEGLVTYLTSNPFRFYGALAPVVMIAGLASLVRPPAHWRPTIFVAAVALGQLVAIGLQSHGQPRYVYFATALLVVLGVDAIRRAAIARPRLAYPRVALAVVGAAWLGVAIALPAYRNRIADERGPVFAAGEAIRADAAGAPCLVIARVVPQLAWYSRCETILERTLADAGAIAPHSYVVSLPGFATTVEPIATATHATATPLPTGDPRAVVWRLAP